MVDFSKLTLESDEKTREFFQDIKRTIRNGILRVFFSESTELLPEEKELKTNLDKDFLKKLCGADLESLKKIHYCLHRAHAEEFNKELGIYLRNIRHSTSNVSNVRNGQVKGKIDWKNTLQTRYKQGHNTSLFACKEVEKDYNLPENIILKFLLLKIRQYIIESNLLEETNETVKDWKAKLAQLKDLIGNVEKNVYFREIGKDLTQSELEKLITSKLESLAKRSRSKFVRQHLLEEAYKEYKLLMIHKDFNKIEEVINKTILSPRNEPRLYELFALNHLILSFMEHIKHGELKALRPGLGGQYLVAFEMPKHNLEVFIYANTLPANFTVRVYPALKKKYFSASNEASFDEQSRRPDIIVEIRKKETGEKEYIILEVKLSNDPSYIKESTYKVMGYLYDFYIDQKDFKFKQAILLVHSWAKQEAVSEDLAGPIIMLNYENYESMIKKIVIELAHKRLNILGVGA